MSENNRIVITGLGMISAIGNNVEECYENALKGVSGIKETNTVDTTNCYARLAAEVNSSEIENDNNDKIDRVTKLCIKACKEAIEDSKMSLNENMDRVSVIMGSCVGGAVSIEHYYRNNKDKNDVLKMPISAIASEVAKTFNCGGVVTNVANACAAGTISIAYASDLIRSGKADVVIAGGADAFASVPYSGFLALHALDSNPCSPFNHCTGITLGEGSGCVIVESYEHAKARNAKIYCEVLGSGISTDAHHITAPREDGEGQMNAINWAIKTSNIDKNDIGYINAHGTGTAKNDNAEFLSLHTIFDNENDDLSVSSTKAMVGHCLGAAGAIEAVFAIKALTTNKVFPTLGYSDEDLVNLKEKAGKIDFVPNESKDKKLTTVMSNSFAFGGNNASIIFSKENHEVEFQDRKNIVLTGIGVISPLGNDKNSYVNNINENKEIEGSSVHSELTQDDFNNVELKNAFYRKLDNLSKIQAVSGMQALKDANLNVTDDNATEIGIVVGSSEGALGTCCNFTENIVQKGNACGSALRFPNTVYNAAGGYLSIASGIKGYNVTVTNGSQSGLQSVAYGMNVIRSGKANYILATGTDENIEVIEELYNKLDLIEDNAYPFAEKNGFRLSDGSVSMVIENEEEANKRNAKVYCKIKGYGMAYKGADFGSLKNTEDGLKNAILNALSDANLKIDDIDCISGFANGYKEVDDIELNVYKDLFKEKLANIPLVEVKDYIGEARSAASSLALCHSALLLNGEIESSRAYYVSDSIVKANVSLKDCKNVLVTSYGLGGTYTAIIISK
ncbi:MAG: beta-ketoacyl-[acyl-carrier-protein] synthase family protein [Acholeplasmatales bacterium]|nr:beta-ketoacyl-[acyl-carrier-protein] synthase family protein [Acholeplasmatales bacterium]